MRIPEASLLSTLFGAFLGVLRGGGASQVTLVVNSLPANAGDTKDESLIPESVRAPGGGHGNLLQYSCLENPMDTPVFLPGKSHGQRSYRPWGCKELGITERLSTAQHSAEH